MNAAPGDLAATSDLLAERARQLAAQAAAPGLATAALAKEVRDLAGSVLRLAAEHAHAGGCSWEEIGGALGISAQAASQRFGRPQGPAPAAAAAAAPVITDAADRAIAVLADWFEERYDAAAGTFGPELAAKLPAAGLAAARDQLTGTAGRYRRLGDNEPLVRQLGDYTVADVPLEFEVGPMKGRVAFDRAGRVGGLYVLPPATP